MAFGDIRRLRLAVREPGGLGTLHGTSSDMPEEVVEGRAGEEAVAEMADGVVVATGDLSRTSVNKFTISVCYTYRFKYREYTTWKNGRANLRREQQR